MLICLPVSSLLCCLLGNVCHSVLPPLARPTLGRSQLSSDPKPVLTLHLDLLPGFTDVSTVSHHSCHGNNALTYCPLSKPQSINLSQRFLLRVEEFVSCACVELLFNTQMCECAAYTFPNISPLMQGAVTFPNNMGGGAGSLVFLTQGFS